MLIDGISRKGLQRLALDTLLQAETLAEDRVYEPRDWPTALRTLPALLVQTPWDRKVGLYPGQLEFNTTIALSITGRAAGTDPEAINELLDELSGQVENALMTAPSFAQCIQRWASVTTTCTINAEGKLHVGEMAMTFELEVFQVFGDPAFAPLISVQGTVIANGGTLAVTGAAVPQVKS